MEYYNEDGTLQQTGGGGVSIDADGTQRALTTEELMEEINSPDVEYKDDGSVWVYFTIRVLTLPTNLMIIMCVL